jgi:uncharacterized protein
VAESRQYLGVGWKFPLQVSPHGRIAAVRYEQRVEESIYLILSTAKGERLMLPEFGCGIHELVFAPNNAATHSLAVQHVQRALIDQERRIDVLDVTVQTTDEQPNLLLVRVTYRIRQNHAIGNIVYPFYLREQT